MSQGTLEGFLQTLVNYLAYYFSRGMAPAEAVNTARKRFGGRVDEYAARAVGIANIANENARRANVADPTWPLRDVLLPMGTYGPTVGVRVLVTGENRTTHEQFTVSNVVHAPLDMTMNEIFIQALFNLCDEHPSICDAIGVETTVIGPMYFPHSTQQ